MHLADMMDGDLIQAVVIGERELVQLRFKHSMNQLENSSELKVLRRNVARLRTEARSRELEQGLRKDELLARYGSATYATTVEGSVETESSFLSGIVDKFGRKE